MQIQSTTFNYYLWLIYGIVLLTYGCAQKQEKNSNSCVYSLDAETANAIVHRAEERLVDSCYNITLHMPDSIAIGKIDAIKTSDSLIFILDSYITSSLSVFSKSGKFLFQIRNQENQPDEFKNIGSFSFSEKENYIIINDRKSLRFYYYSLDGKFQYSKRIEQHFSDINILSDNTLLTVSDEEVNEEEYKGIEIWHNIDSLPTLTYFSKLPSSINAVRFSSFSFVQDRGWFFANPMEDIIYKIANNGEFTPYVRIDFGNQGIPEEFWNASDVEELEMLEQYVYTNQNTRLIPHLFFEDARNIQLFFVQGGRTLNNYFWAYDKQTNESAIGEVPLNTSNAIKNGTLVYPMAVTKNGFYIAPYYVSNSKGLNETLHLYFYKPLAVSILQSTHSKGE